ncbi:two pore potassium channel protein sup-9 [Exaiptasia diaphana]|uniref:Potassium channel domain-containing protein n=1 Tax=Exaiptasia diaphana TaxID=2652724 RepID=A0A913XTG1_EXADI|nr:two pore potassium channel protein sup-9 [Exaiptasia diaphana]KXJ09255.1 Two pore potassium channel protein sup-9 [Exaiptasia diaphana]
MAITRLTTDTKRLICLILLLGIYLFCGAAVFQVLENENEARAVVHLNDLRKTFHRKYNVSRKEFDFLVHKISLATKYRCGGPMESWCSSRWSYYASLYFTWSVVTTIGYGHLAPATMEGRIFCMIFAFFGIPLNLMILKSIGDRINDVIHYVHYRITVQLSDSDDVTVKTRTLVWTLGFMILTLLVGAILYTQTQNWTIFEAIYFCFVTFSTIGFGDLVPNEGEPPTTLIDSVLEIFHAAVIILGLSMFFSIISSILSASEELRIAFPSNTQPPHHQESTKEAQEEPDNDKPVKTEND